MALAQGSLRGIVHDQKRETVLHTEIQNANDMWVYQVGDGARFMQEVIFFIIFKLHLEYFDSCLCF